MKKTRFNAFSSLIWMYEHCTPLENTSELKTIWKKGKTVMIMKIKVNGKVNRKGRENNVAILYDFL